MPPPPLIGTHTDTCVSVLSHATIILLPSCFPHPQLKILYGILGTLFLSICKVEKVTQGGTQTHDLANGLPCSNQLSYRVTRQLSGQVQVLKAELPGIQPKQIPRWHVRWEHSFSSSVRWRGFSKKIRKSEPLTVFHHLTDREKKCTPPPPFSFFLTLWMERKSEPLTVFLHLVDGERVPLCSSLFLFLSARWGKTVGGTLFITVEM